jgi:hypothetical protein
MPILVVRYGTQYYMANRPTLPAAEVRRRYRLHSQLEDVIRGCQDHLGLTGCQARSARARRRHIACGSVALCVLERERHERGRSIDKLKRQLSFRECARALPTCSR